MLLIGSWPSKEWHRPIRGIEPRYLPPELDDGHKAWIMATARRFVGDLFEKGFFVAFDFTSDALRAVGSFFKKSG